MIVSFTKNPVDLANSCDHDPIPHLGVSDIFFLYVYKILIDLANSGDPDQTSLCGIWDYTIPKCPKKAFGRICWTDPVES